MGALEQILEIKLVQNLNEILKNFKIKKVQSNKSEYNPTIV